MLAAVSSRLVFDGRDIADAAEDLAEVLGYQVATCPHCGTLRDARFPFCCELAAEPAPTRLPVPC